MHGEFFVTFNKKFSSFALFEGKGSTKSSPYQTSMKYHGSKHDTELLTQMRTWLVNHPSGEFRLLICLLISLVHHLHDIMPQLCSFHVKVVGQ
jgi:hypothetical protein